MNKKSHQFYLTPEEIVAKGYLYVAYGSNLDLDQMAFRTPSSFPIGTLELPNWELVFRGVADIIPKDGASVSLGIFNIPTVEDWEALHRYEGTRPDRAMYYLTEIETDMGTALTYTMSAGYLIGSPNQSYYDTIERGFGHFGMDTAPLVEARKRADAQSTRIRKPKPKNSWYSDYLNAKTRTYA